MPIACLATAAFGSAAASAHITAHAAKATKLQHLTVAEAPASGNADVLYAQKSGLFAKQHLKVTFKTMAGGTLIVPALESNSVQMGTITFVEALQGAAHGIDTPCFTGNVYGPLSIVGSKKDGVASAQNLEGKTVAVQGVGGLTQVLVDIYLKKNGVSPSSVNFVSMQFPDMPAAIASGQVAAAFLPDPFTTILKLQGNPVLSANPVSYVRGNPTFVCWAASKSWLTKNPRAAAGFAKAIAQAHVYLHAHPAVLRQLIEKILPIPSSVLAQMGPPTWSTDATVQDVKAWEQVAKQYSLIKSAPPLSDVLMPAKK